MKRYKIYTAGRMSGLTYEQQMGWRSQIEKLIRDKSDANIVFVHPPQYYNYEKHEHQTDAEVKIWDLSQVRDSDLVILNLENIAESSGTQYELGVVESMNSFGSKHIHLIGVGHPDTDHPWIGLSLLRREDTLEDAAEYITNYLLI